MKKITSTHYQKETLYPAVSRAIAEIVQDGEVVTPVEVFADFSGYLSRDDHPRAIDQMETKRLRDKNTKRPENWGQEHEGRLKPGHQRALVSSLQAICELMPDRYG